MRIWQRYCCWAAVVVFEGPGIVLWSFCKVFPGTFWRYCHKVPWPLTSILFPLRRCLFFGGLWWWCCESECFWNAITFLIIIVVIIFLKFSLSVFFGEFLTCFIGRGREKFSWKWNKNECHLRFFRHQTADILNYSDEYFWTLWKFQTQLNVVFVWNLSNVYWNSIFKYFWLHH